MLKINILQLGLLIGLASCGQSTESSKQQTSQISTGSESEAEPHAAKIPAVLLTLDEAKINYKSYTDKVKARVLPQHKCNKETKPLKYIRIPKGHIYEHIQIVESQLPEPNSDYAGIRIYPYLDLTNVPGTPKTYRYLLCYTTLIDGDPKRHRDKKDNFYIISIPVDFDWCKLWSTTIGKKLNPTPEETKSAHHTCEPDCPPGDQALLSF